MSHENTSQKDTVNYGVLFLCSSACFRGEKFVKGY